MTSSAPSSAPAGQPDCLEQKAARQARDDAPIAGFGRGFGHGKVILLGEHAVVYDQPALAAALSLGISAEATQGSGILAAPEWRVRARSGDGSQLGEAFVAILRQLDIGDDDVDVELTGELPPRAGLGSSAAVAVAVARAVAQARGRSDEAALAAAHAAEVVFHGTPSGIDLAVASSAGIGCFQRGSGWRPVTTAQPMSLCVGLSAVERDTRAQVDAVRRLRTRTPAVASVMAVLGELAVAGEQTLRRGDVDELGRLFDLAHGLLSGLRVSCLELDTLVHHARAAGAIGAKLTGAGGGGAVVALAPGHEQDVLARWRAAGFRGFVATIGQTTAASVSRPGPVGVASSSVPVKAQAPVQVQAEAERAPQTAPRPEAAT